MVIGSRRGPKLLRKKEWRYPQSGIASPHFAYSNLQSRWLVHVQSWDLLRSTLDSRHNPHCLHCHCLSVSIRGLTLNYVLKCYPEQISATMTSVLFLRSLFSMILIWPFQYWLNNVSFVGITGIGSLLSSDKWVFTSIYSCG